MPAPKPTKPAPKAIIIAPTDGALITKTELARLESQVEHGLTGMKASYQTAIKALAKIRETRGYLLLGYNTFTDYCDAKWGFTLRHGERLIQAAQTDQVAREVLGEAPRNEGAARELGPVVSTPELLPKIQKELKRDGVSVATATAAQIKTAVQTVTGAAPKGNNGNGNGNGNGHHANDEQPAPRPKLPAGMTDVCPSCHETPETYFYGEYGWACGGCGQPVKLAVYPVNLTACENCGAGIAEGAEFCPKCGEPA